MIFQQKYDLYLSCFPLHVVAILFVLRVNLVSKFDMLESQ